MAYEDLGPKEFLTAYKAAGDNAVLLDVRTPQEIEEASIDGHVDIDMYAPGFMDKLNQLDKSKAYFIYCRSGNRSGQTCRYLATQGFDKLYNLKGGIIAWMDTDFDE